MNKKVILLLTTFLLVLPIASAASINIYAPQYLVEDQATTVNITVSADPTINGTLVFTYTNLDSTTTSISVPESSFVNNTYNYEWIVTAQQASEFSIHATLKDQSNLILATQNKTGTINSSGPEVVATYPVGTVSSNSATITIITKEDATCRFDTSNKAYDSMAFAFSQTGGTNSSHLVESLSEGTYTYYVRCKDDAGKVSSTSSIIQFTVDDLPSAQIKLKDQTPVKEGIIEVEVITSKPLPDAPLLEYSFNDFPNTRFKISLTGSETRWHGFLVVTDNDDNKVGTFYFRGVDGLGNVGTKISNDNLFVVDTAKPIAPISAKAVSVSDGSIRVNWYYDGEEVDYYNVYRTTTSGVNYVDHYGSANETETFFDSSTVDKVTYYYKISAVDLAGNEGPLSQEVFATSLNKISSPKPQDTTQDEEDAPQVLPPNLVPIVDAAVKDIEKILIDVRDNLGDIEIQGSEKQLLLDRFNIKKELRDAETKLETMVSQLESYKQSYASLTELETKIRAVNEDADRLEKSTPIDANVVEQTEFTQVTAKDDVTIAGKEALKDIGLTQEQVDDYIKFNTKLKDDFEVLVDAQIVSVEYLDASKKEHTFVNKLVTYKKAEPLEDVVIVEIIPKKMAANVNQVSFTNKQFEVLNEDPVVKFGFLSFDYQGEEISYSLDRRIDLEEVKNSKSIALLSNEAEGSGGSLITGFSIFPISSLGLSKTQSIFVWLGILIIVSMLLYYLFFVRVEGFDVRKIKKGLSVSRMKTYVENKRLGRQFKHHTSHYPHYDLEDLPSMEQRKMQSHSTIQAQAQNPVNMGVVELQQLINQANMMLLQDQTKQAASVYNQISLHYQSLPKEMKSQFYQQCAELHRKVNGK